MSDSTTAGGNSATDKPPRSRRRIPVALKLFVAWLLITGTVGFGWLGLHYRRQQLIMRAIEKLGGRMMIDNRAPDRVRQLLGPERSAIFDEVSGVDLNFTRATDEDLAELKALGGLTQARYLGLDGTLITDEGLVHVNGLSQIRMLKISETRVTDAGLKHLAHLPGLTILGLQRTAISDAGLVHLGALSNLDGLELHGTKVTDAGLVHLRGLKKLSLLSVPSTEVTETGIAELKRDRPDLAVWR